MSPAIAKFIATRDARMSALRGYKTAPMRDNFHQLLTTGRVVVGGRATSGPKTDPSWVEFRTWNEVVAKARRLGYAIEEKNIPQKNSWATLNGGFWTEREYTLETEQ